MRESDEIDRSAWKLLLTELLAAAGMTPEQAAKPAGPISANWRTIRRWLGEDQGVTAKSVRDVCRDLGYPPVEALVRVGFLSADEARLTREPVAAPPPLPPPLRQIADVLTDRRIPEDTKAQLRAAVQAGFDLWKNMLGTRPPRERPPSRDKPTPSAGK